MSKKKPTHPEGESYEKALHAPPRPADLPPPTNEAPLPAGTCPMDTRSAKIPERTEAPPCHRPDRDFAPDAPLPNGHALDGFTIREALANIRDQIDRLLWRLDAQDKAPEAPSLQSSLAGDDPQRQTTPQHLKAVPLRPPPPDPVPMPSRVA